jgi:CRISPR-associated protein Csb2
VTELMVHCPQGFGPEERAALESLKEVWGYGGYDVQLRLHGLGGPDDLMSGKDNIFSSSSTWESVTPFIPTRHAKATRTGVPKLDENGLQIGSPEHDLIRLIELEGLSRPISVELLPNIDFGGRKVRWGQFRRERRTGEGRKGEDVGLGYRVVFPEPVKGPLSVGFGCHFGMGLFRPVEPYGNKQG